jgi:hypothetical protein
MSLFQRMLLVLCALFSGGCATVANSAHPVTFTTFGDAETINQRQKDVLERFKAIRANPPLDKLGDVKILQNATPEGIEIKDGTISVKEGYPHVVLGKFTLSSALASTIWFADYEPTWRKGYCYPQVPLTWVTIGLWQFLVPLAYPCWGGKLSHDVAIQQMKTLAVVVGANLIVAEIVEADDVVGRVNGILIRTNLDSLGPPHKLPDPSKSKVPSTADARPEPAGPVIAVVGPAPAGPSRPDTR